MKKHAMILVAGFAAFSCGQKQSNVYTLQGVLNGAPDSTKVYLGSTAKNFPLDSAYVVGDRFVFTGTLDEPVPVTLGMSREPGYVLKDIRSTPDNLSLYLEPGQIVVTSHDSLKNASISGSIINDDMARYNSLVKPFDDKRNELWAHQRQLIEEKGWTKANLEEIAEQVKELFAQEEDVKKEFVYTRTDSFFAFHKLLPDFISADDLEESEKLFNSFDEELKATSVGQVYATRLERYHATKPGQPAPGFSMPDQEGNMVNLSDFLGQYVLIDFWASWCLPCRFENPHVIAAYEEYKDLGFTVLGVSLDGAQPEPREKWLKAIEADGLPWTNVCDFTVGEENIPARLYGITSIPMNFLVNPEGVIIARNLRGEKLKETLSEFLD